MVDTTAVLSMISGLGGAALGAIAAMPPPYADPRTDHPADPGSDGGRPA
ncbi:hypothetical protein [Streptomyces sp. Amel2xB2]|nr:hypothetical protein [Streptomyces sp. Amel2xB2]